MAIVKKYTAEVVSVKSTMDDVYTVEMRSLDKPFKYVPGQFLHLALDEFDPSFQWPDSRCFSMQSSPTEELIRITYAVKGKFTLRMKNELIVGKRVTLKMPYGDLFTQPHSKENAVFIAGGTGITPFLSLFNHYSFQEYKNPRIYLGFRKRAYNIYDSELKQIEYTNPSYFYEEINGLLDINQIFSENGVAGTYFISGPPQMIKDFRNFLINKNLPPNQVISDDWE